MSQPKSGYAPHELQTDAAALGLATTTVHGELGSCVARHSAIRSSTRATIFLHGAAGSWTTWTPLLEEARLHELDIGDILLLDLPGWGEAELSFDVTRGNDSNIAAICELVKEVAEQLGYTEWDLVGHSLGGFIALHMASLWPECVMSVGMVSGTTFSIIDCVEHPFRGLFRLPGFVGLWRVMQVFAALGPAGTAFVRGMGVIGLLRPVTSPLFRHWTAVPRSQGVALSHELRPRAFAAAVNSTHGYDTSRWASIGCEVRALKGDRDVFVRDDDLDRLAAMLPSSTAVIIDDCGHFGALERPREVLVGLGFLPPGAS